MTEEQIAQYMRTEVEKMGLAFAWDPQVCPAVFSGPETAGAHYNPTKRKVKPGLPHLFPKQELHLVILGDLFQEVP